MLLTELEKGPSRLLLVDDEESNLLTLEAALHELGTIQKVQSGEQALEAINIFCPHVVLLDIEMPGMNGFEVCRKIKENPDTRNIAVIFVTAHGESKFESTSFELGAIEFISKPFDFRLCKLRVNNQLVLQRHTKELEDAKRKIFAEKERLKVTLNSIGDAVIATDIKANVTFMNPIAERMTGWVSGDAVGEHITKVMNLTDAYSKEVSINPVVLALQEQRIVAMALNSQITSLDGTTYRVEDSAAPIRDDGGVIGAIIVFHDISEAVAMAVKMSYLANHDQLTALPNRVMLHDRLQHACKVSSSKGTSVALLLIDVDHFKYLNDSLGHHLGDSIIKQVGVRLEKLFDPETTVARVGGDSFVVVLPEVSSPQFVDKLASNIIHEMKSPFLIGQAEYKLTVSIGISINPSDANTEESMMRHADVAMYRAKQQGRNCYCYFSGELEQILLERQKFDSLLRHSLGNNLLQVHFQPQFDLRSGKLIGAEALVRMPNSEGQLVPPLLFIPMAEETGLIHQLGAQVLRKSCLAAKKWLDAGYKLRVAVNVSAVQFANPRFCDSVEVILKETQLPSQYLELELTESALFADFEQTKSCLQKLTSLGVSIAIDDFGTGYSSLSYLKLFSINVLKIDQSFVRDMLSDVQSLDIVRTIVNLAKSLNMKLIGEGIETLEHKQKLAELGCEMGQGFLFSPPMPIEEYSKYLANSMSFSN